jgi:beta-fructofuranosidase
MDLRFNENVYERLDVKLESPLRSLRVFLDHSSAELFFNDGERTFTTHLYPTERELNYTVKDGAKLRIWEMTRSVTDEFAV